MEVIWCTFKKKYHIQVTYMQIQWQIFEILSTYQDRFCIDTDIDIDKEI